MVWSDSEHDKCVKNVERLVVQTHKLHLDEETTKARASACSSSAALKGSALAKLRAAEMHELRLLVEAVKAKDVIGVVSLCSAFFQHKNSLSRQKALLERLIPPPAKVELLLERLRSLQPRVLSLPPSCAHDEEGEEGRGVAGKGGDGDDAAGREQQQPQLGGELNGADFADTEVAAQCIEAGNVLQLVEMTVALQERMRQLASIVDDVLRRADRSAASRSGAGGPSNEIVAARRGGDGEQQGEVEEEEAQRLEQIVGVVNQRMAASRDAAEELKRKVAQLRDDATAAAAQLGLVARYPSGDGAAAASRAQLQSLADGGAPWQLVRLCAHVASPGDAVSSIAESFGTQRTMVAFAATGEPIVQANHSDFRFTRATPVVVQVASEVKGIDEATASLARRIELLESTQLPAAEERVVLAREAVWEAEVSVLQHPLRQDAKANEARAIAEQLEKERDALRAALRQCRQHMDALHNADIGALSFLLEGKVLETLEGLGNFERVIYTCKEIDPELTLEEFAASIGLPKSELLVFADNDNNRTFAYIPTIIPRASVVEADQRLRAEIAAHREKYPTRPPRTDLMEQLAALRSGDCAALCAMVAAARDAAKNSRWEQEIERLTVEMAHLQEERNELEACADERREQLDIARAETARVREQLASAQNEASSAATARATRERELELRQSRQEEILVAARAEADAANTRADQLLREVNAAKERAAVLERQLNDDASKHDELAARAAALHEQRLKQLESDASRLTRALEEKSRELDSKSAELQNDKSVLKHEVARLKEEAQLASQQQEAQLQAERSRLTVALEQAQQEASRLVGELRHASSSIATLRRENGSLTQQAAAHAAELAALRASLEQAKGAEQQLRSFVADRDAEIGALREQADAAASKLGGLSPSKLQRELELARERLLDSQRRAEVAESECAALRADLAAAEDLSRRVVYVCREVPTGRALEDFAEELGIAISGLLPFFDETTATMHCYMPTQVPRSSVDAEDAALRRALEAARAKDATQRAAIRVAEQLSALRCGDAAALSQMLTAAAADVERLERVIAKLRVMQPVSSTGGSGSTSPSPPALAGLLPRAALARHTSESGVFVADLDAVSIDDEEAEEDEDEWFNAQVARKKIALLREELQRGKKREANWKKMCDEYRDQGKLRDAELALEEAKADFEQRIRAKEALLLAAQSELDELRAALAESERKRSSEAEAYTAQRQRQLAEREEILSELRAKLLGERERHAATLKRIAAERQREQQRIGELEALLREYAEEGEESEEGEEEEGREGEVGSGHATT